MHNFSEMSPQTAKTYLPVLLAFCKPSQIEFFYKMYPTGPTLKQVPWALQQIQNTLETNAQARKKSLQKKLLQKGKLRRALRKLKYTR